MRWLPRPAPEATALIAALPRTKDDVYFYVFPPSAFHFDGSRFTAIRIEGVVSRRMDPEAPVSLVSRGEHVWLYSSHRVWKLASEDAPQSAPITF